MKWSRVVPVLVLTMLGAAGCGDADSSPGDAGPGPDETFMTSYIEVEGPELAELGEYADLGDGLRVRLDATGVDNDTQGPWMDVTVRAENDGQTPRPEPLVTLYCEQSDDGGGQRWSEEDGPGVAGTIDPGDTYEADLDLLLPGDTQMGDVIPECEGSAYLEAATYGDDPNNALSSAQWEVPEAFIDELNEDRLDAYRSPAPPPEPAKDPDRPYAWVEEDVYSSGYALILVRGLSVPEVLRAMGGIQRDAGILDPAERSDLQYELEDPETYAAPTVVTAAEHDGGVVVHVPFGYHVSPRLARALSRKGVAATYGNTVNGDDHIVVARKGRVLRNFDPFLDTAYDKNGPLPEEKGLDLENDTGPASWTLLERLTSIHVTPGWLEGDQPTYVLRD